MSILLLYTRVFYIICQDKMNKIDVFSLKENFLSAVKAICCASALSLFSACGQSGRQETRQPTPEELKQSQLYNLGVYHKYYLDSIPDEDWKKQFSAFLDQYWQADLQSVEEYEAWNQSAWRMVADRSFDEVDLGEKLSYLNGVVKAKSNVSQKELTDLKICLEQMEKTEPWLLKQLAENWLKIFEMKSRGDNVYTRSNNTSDMLYWLTTYGGGPTIWLRQWSPANIFHEGTHAMDCNGELSCNNKELEKIDEALGKTINIYLQQSPAETLANYGLVYFLGQGDSQQYEEARIDKIIQDIDLWLLEDFLINEVYPAYKETPEWAREAYYRPNQICVPHDFVRTYVKTNYHQAIQNSYNFIKGFIKKWRLEHPSKQAQ